ncbi:hypothetical protein [Actinacidiphila acididurans]|uniref:Lipoprotein n=1 Tax=Actinacidiphila acididurans TaxID=2784346 RepID=A0ABS2TP98_9ACTN|nr:hypothetical protein [Actinacidiphila acididurans]MBM9504897.1 hypothetical protein [Actinacidiphila acididurans]
MDTAYVQLRSVPHHRFIAASKEFVIVTKRTGLAAAGVVALIAAGSAACGTAQATPQAKVQSAFTKLGDQKAVTLGLSFDATADQIYAVMQGDDFTRQDAELLSKLRATLSVSTQKQIGLLTSGSNATDATKDGAAGFTLSADKSGNSNLIDLRAVNQKLYLRADIKGLEKLDTSPNASSDLREFNQFLNQADQLPSSLNAVKAGLKGQWVEIDPKAWLDFGKSMAKQMGGSGSSSSPFDALTGPKIDPKTEAKLFDAIKQAFVHNATFKDLGNSNGADHVQVTVPARQLAKELSTSLPPILKQFPGVKASDLKGLSDTSGVPNRTISFDVALKGKDISALTVDLAQFDDKATGNKLPLTLTIDHNTDALTAPSDAQQLNPQDLVGLFMANANPSGSSFSS